MLFSKRMVVVFLIIFSAIPLLGFEVDNQDHDGVIHSWSWAVNEVNSGGGGSITFDLPNNQTTNNGGSFTEYVYIDGGNVGGVNITCNSILTFNVDGCTVENMAYIQGINCNGSDIHSFSKNSYIGNVDGNGDYITFYSNTLVNASLGEDADLSYNLITGNVTASSNAKFYNNSFNNGAFNGGSFSEITSNGVSASTGTIIISNHCEVSSCSDVLLDVRGNNNTISKCRIKYDFVINGNSNLLDRCDVISSANLSVAGSNNTIQNSMFTGNSYGVLVATNSVNTTIKGCHIHDNAIDGIRVLGNNCQIGGTLGDGNAIYQNAGNGVSVINTKDVYIYGNFIGTTNSTSTNDVGNMGAGVFVDNSEDVRIGQYAAGGQNEIRYNKSSGIQYECDDNIEHNIHIENNLFRQNAGAGIKLDGGHNVSITGNYIGTDATDASTQGNIGPGIYIQDSTGVKIGGNLPAARNIISANQGAGIHFEGSQKDDFLGGLVRGNYIGTTRNGYAPLPNSGSGVMLSRAWGITFGGGQPGDGNVISGNAEEGIRIQLGDGHDSGQNIIQGNYIGTGPEGTSAVPNMVGIYLSGVSNAVGGTVTNQRNIISGNSGDGIKFFMESSSSEEDTNYNLIQGNYIGVDITGNVALPNEGNGIAVSTALYFAGQIEFNVIGGTNGVGYTTRNVISGNGSNGISFVYGQTDIDGNYIGISADGLSSIGNGAHGILLGTTNYSSSANIGVREGNVISGNGLDGIRVHLSTSVIQNNLIGPAPGCSSLFPNGGNGISLMKNSFEVVVGKARNDGGNIIVGNMGSGIVDDGNDNVIVGNWIGVCPAPHNYLAHNLGIYGIHVLSGTDATIGGYGVTGNVINAEIGIGMESARNSAPSILGNIIGFNPDTSLVSTNLRIGIQGRNINSIQIGSDRYESGNQIGAASEYGIFLENCTNGTITANRIGCASNISGFITNAGHGIAFSNCSGIIVGEILGIPSTNYIAGSDIGIWMQNCNECRAFYDWVGIAPDGTVLGNRGDGIRIDGGDYNHVGEPGTNMFSVISANEGVGIRVSDASRFNLYRTIIGANPAGDSALPNLQGGVLIVNSINSTVGQGLYLNLISGNTDFGIRIEGTNSNWNHIRANRIGLALNTENAIPNSGDGIVIEDAADNDINLNTIWHNTSNGVHVIGNMATGNRISQNSIYSNGVRGICLSTGGTVNDSQDPDIGPNNLQNYPVITNAYRGSTLIYGTFNGKPNHEYEFEYFTSQSVNLSGFAEGQNYIDSEWITTDANGDYDINAWIYRTSPTGMIVTAVAIDSTTDDTSEFTLSSPYVVVETAPDSNGNGMPDFYEQMYPYMAAAHSEGSDYDGDGVSDLDEYLAFTNPEDINSYFRLEITHDSVDIPGSSMGREYILERTTNLLDNTAWTLDTIRYEGNEFILKIPIDTEIVPSKVQYRGRVEIP